MAANRNPEHTHTPRDFLRFPELALEIRLQIWRATFPPPRRVYFDTIACCRDRTRAKALPADAPVSLYINQESRKETRRHYDIFRNEYKPRCSKGPAEARKSTTFICPERDILVLCSLELFPSPDLFISAIAQFGGRLEGGLEAIRKVEFTSVDWRIVFGWNSSEKLWEVIRSLPGLSTLRLAAFEEVGHKTRQRALGELEKQKGSFVRGVPPKLSFVRVEGPPTKEEVHSLDFFFEDLT
ncbi:hypothetical protein N431DRAFT_444673 [Stipitochalara longipes BDJ]|nr:hypothetical protein N431DRAFT_444673 [Stipitochalara longipes BDJ]